MASSTIAGALCVGKGAFDRAEILRATHATARWLRARAAFPRPYASCLNDALRTEWRKAKQKAAQAASEAAEAALDALVVPLPPTIAARIADLRLLASVQSLTASGTRQFRALNAEADHIAMAARCMIIPAPDNIHVTH